MSLLKKCILLYSIFLLLNCSSKDIRENKQTADWIMEHVKETVRQKDISKENPKNYKLVANVLVAEENKEGDPWMNKERTENPNVKLYILNNSEAPKILLGSKENSLLLYTEYPLRLRKDETITLRLVYTKGSFRSKQYINKYSYDSSDYYKEEYPLANTNVTFKGQGKYIKFSGSAILSLEFIELND